MFLEAKAANSSHKL